jgi:hypothetical protein
VRYLVASEELVPGHSWPYQEIFGALRANPNLAGADFARLIVDRYVSYYKENPPVVGDVTKVALDLGRIEELAGATDQLADALGEDMGQHGDLLWTVQQSTKEHETRNGKRKQSKFDYYLWDIGSLASRLSGAKTGSAALRKAADSTRKALIPGASCVLTEGHLGDWFDGIGGVSIYFTRPRDRRISPWYSKLAFAHDTKWDEMLYAYHEHFE